jgi:hypothetical protein
LLREALRSLSKYALFTWIASSLFVNLAEAQSLEVIETEQSISVEQDNKTVLTYVKVSPPAPPGINPIFERSGCLHPVSSPRGHTVTAMFPADHAHQHGIFSAWVKATYDGQTIDFWNLAARKGCVLHQRVIAIFDNSETAGFEVDLIHRVETLPTVDVLRERWKVTVYPTDGTYHQFDLETTQTALTDKPLIVDKHHYGGFALRGPTRWLTGKDSDGPKQGEVAREPSGFLNDLGSNRIHGNHQHAKWVSLWGTIDQQPVSITVLCHAANFRAPQAARLHPTKPYFCFAPCVDGEFSIDRDHPFQSRYRYLITDAKPDSQWINQQWSAWCGDKVKK